MRVATGGIRRKTDDLEELADAAARIAPAGEAVSPERLPDDATDAVARVQRRERILEDHLHPAPQRSQLALAQRGDIATVEHDPPGRRLVEPEDRPTDGRLAAARFAHEPEGLAAADRQRDVVDSANVADVAVEHDAALDREPDPQVLELDEVAAAVFARAQISTLS